MSAGGVKKSPIICAGKKPTKYLIEALKEVVKRRHPVYRMAKQNGDGKKELDRILEVLIGESLTAFKKMCVDSRGKPKGLFFETDFHKEVLKNAAAKFNADPANPDERKKIFEKLQPGKGICECPNKEKECKAGKPTKGLLDFIKGFKKPIKKRKVDEASISIICLNPSFVTDPASFVDSGKVSWLRSMLTLFDLSNLTKKLRGSAK